jgi:hypothetical protein
MDSKDQRIAELEASLAEKTRQWEGTKKIAVEQGYHKAARERAEAENTLLRRALVELGGDRALVQALRAKGAEVPAVSSEGTLTTKPSDEDQESTAEHLPERDPAVDAEGPAMRF